MDKRLLSKSSILGASLGALVLAATLPARAEPERPDARKAASTAGTDSAEAAPAEPTALTTRTVALPADVAEMTERVNRPLALTSSVLFATGYAPAVITAMANSKETSGWLAVPVVGPWVEWGPNTSPGNKILLFGSGLLQAAGVAGLVTSFFVPESKTDKIPMMGKRRFHVAPVAGGGSYALSATGRF
jgi:hypothetical protein